MTVVRRLVEPLIRLLFGDDVFISYSRQDGINYAGGLAAELARRGLSCRVDLWETERGPAPPKRLLRALRRSSMLVVIGTEASGQSAYVEAEIKEFAKIRPSIVAVDLDGTIERASWFDEIRGLPRAREENANARTTGIPSPAVASRIDNSITFMRRNRRVQAGAAIALLVMAVAGLAAERAANAAARATAEASAMAMNTDIAAAQQAEPLRVRERAAAAVHAYATYPNGRSSELLALALASANHFLARHHLPDSASVVSRNGLHVASWNEKRQEITVRALDEQIRVEWVYSIAVPGSVRVLEGLAVSNDGTRVAISVLDAARRNRDTFFIVESLPAARAARETPRERFRSGRSPLGSMRFQELSFSNDSQYVWGDQLRPVEATGTLAPSPLVFRIGDGRVDTLRAPLPAGAEGDLSDIAVSEDGGYGAVLTTRGDGSAGTGTIVAFTLPELRVRASFPAPDRYPDSIAFAPTNAHDMIVVGARDRTNPRKLYTIVTDWPSAGRKAEAVESLRPIEFGGMRQRFAFLPRFDAAVLLTRLQVMPSPSGNRPTPVAPVIRNYRELPELAGALLNGATAPESELERMAIVSAGVRADSGAIVTSDRAGFITVWDPFFKYGAPHAAIKDQPVDLFTSRASPDVYVGERVYGEGVGLPRRLRLSLLRDWDSQAPQARTVLEVPFVHGRLTMSPALNLVAVPGFEGAGHDDSRYVVTLHGVPGGDVKGTLAGFPRERVNEDPCRVRSFSPDGQGFVCLDARGQLLTWDLRLPAAPAAVVRVHNTAAEDADVAFSHDSRYLAVGFHERIEVWERWRTHQPWKVSEIVIDDSDDDVIDLAISADGAYLAAAMENGVARVWRNWRTPAPTPVRDLTRPASAMAGPGSRLISLAFHPTEPDVIAVLDSTTLWVHSVEDMNPLVRLPVDGFQSDGAVRFSGDGRHVIATLSRANGVILSLWRAAEMTAVACRSFLFEEQHTSGVADACSGFRRR